MLLWRKIVAYFPASFLIVCMPCTFNIIKTLLIKTLLSSSFLQDGPEKLTPDPVGHHLLSFDNDI